MITFFLCVLVIKTKKILSLKIIETHKSLANVDLEKKSLVTTRNSELRLIFSCHMPNTLKRGCLTFIQDSRCFYSRVRSSSNEQAREIITLKKEGSVLRNQKTQQSLSKKKKDDLHS